MSGSFMELTIDQALQKGIEAHKARQFQEADKYYTAILEAQPEHPDANHNMGVLAVSVGKVQESILFFETAREANPNIAQFWLSYIDALIKLNRLVDAKAVLYQARGNGAEGDGFDKLERKLLQTAESLTSQNSSVNTALELRESGKFSQAINLLKDELNKFPLDANILALLSHCYILNENIEEAIIQFDKAKNLDPNNALVGWNEVRLLLKKKSVSEALVVARLTNKRFPNDVEGMGVLGSCLRANNELVESLSYLDKAIESKPNYAEALINRGLIHLSKENKVEALEDLEAAHRQKPHVREIWDLVIGLKTDFKEFAEAISLLDGMIKIDPGDEKLFVRMALCYQLLADFDLAIVAYKKALLIKPDYAEAYNNMGIALTEQGKLEEAIEAFNKAIIFQPNYADPYNNKANALKNQGKLEEAIQAYDKAMAIKPDNVDALNNTARLFYQTGQYEKAAKLFRKNTSSKGQMWLLKCLYHLDHQSKFCKQLDYLIDQGENNAIIGSYTSRSKIRYGINRENPFCNKPLQYVSKIDLAQKCDFKDIFVKGALKILSEGIVQSRKQNLLMKGSQTSGNVFGQMGPYRNRIQDIIRMEIENYRLRFIDSSEGLITSWPDSYKLDGWIVKMRNGGAIKPHMHDQGWISGSVYINVPPKLKKDSGNLVVCVESETSKIDEGDYSKNIDVVTGSLCLFPSSLLHYTIPFEADEDRIVMAFDIVPE